MGVQSSVIAYEAPAASVFAGMSSWRPSLEVAELAKMALPSASLLKSAAMTLSDARRRMLHTKLTSPSSAVWPLAKQSSVGSETAPIILVEVGRFALPLVFPPSKDVIRLTPPDLVTVATAGVLAVPIRLLTTRLNRSLAPDGRRLAGTMASLTPSSRAPTRLNKSDPTSTVPSETIVHA